MTKRRKKGGVEEAVIETCVCGDPRSRHPRGPCRVRGCGCGKYLPNTAIAEGESESVIEDEGADDGA